MILVTNIQRFSTHDGDGIRTTVFLKGCPLSCFWCHNPEAVSTKNQIFFTARICIGCGKCITACKNSCHILEASRHTYSKDMCTGCGSCAQVCSCGAIEPAARLMTVEEIVGECLSDKAFYSNGGGVTLSGGEPMAVPENCLALLRGLKEQGLNTAVETCGYFGGLYAPALAELADTVLYDIKDTNDSRHIKNTGVSNRRIIENLKLLDDLGVPTIMRCIIINGVNDDEEHLRGIADIFKRLSNCRYVELLAYHCMGISKSERLHMSSIGGKELVPGPEKIEDIKRLLTHLGIKVK